MSKRLMRLLLIFLLLSLMGTPVQAMDCEWVSKFKANSGTEILREEYEQLLKKIVSYSVCIDKEIKNILSEMTSSATEGTNRAQLILTLEEKLREIKNADENINQQLLKQEHQYDQFREEVKSIDTTFNKLVESLELYLATQIKGIKDVDNELKSKLELTANQITELSASLTDTDNKMDNVNNTLANKMSGLEVVDDELKSKLESAANQINELSASLTDTGSKVDSGLSDLNKTLATQIGDLKGADDKLKSELERTAGQVTDLIAKLTNTDKKTDNLSDLNNKLNATLDDKTLYGIVLILIVTLLVILLFMLLRKSVFKQRTDLNSDLEGMKKEIEEESIRLDNKLISLIESQLSIEGSKESNSGEIDHSLALKVADEIVRIQKNTSRMDPKIKGLKQLVASVKRIQDNFSSNGYEIVEMLGQPYDEGMNVSANFIPDEDLNENEQIITKIIKPQVNYQGVMIQAAQIEVSQGG
jgi:hypothetical protein